jgi:hypothetical protein
MLVADTLLRLAEPPGLYQPRWTAEILAEMTRTLVGRFGKSPEKAVYRETAMREFFPSSMVKDYEHIVAGMRTTPRIGTCSRPQSHATLTSWSPST